MSTNVKAKVNPDVETLDAQDESEVIRYELMVIVTPDVSQADYEKHVEEVKALLNAHHAQVEHTEDWGKRDLAYSIKRKTNGYYYVLDFKMDPAEAPELNKQLRITPFVLRYLVVKLSEDYVPQKYDLETPKRPEYKPEAQKTQAHKPRAAAPARAAAKEARSGSADPSAGFGGMGGPRQGGGRTGPQLSSKETKVEAPAKASEKPKEDLSKLDEKLEELLSGGDDLNL